jgi:NAD(P)-dependent dehydrogenase (short-subunit alcohol dehydrogenase family)
MHRGSFTLRPPTHLVTGANAGIGLEIARGLARAGAHVVLACRNPAKAEAARRSILEAQPSARVELLIVDLASQRSIREAAASFASGHSSLDVVVNNAAAVSDTRQESVDGIELTFATNVLAYHLLSNLLRPLLERAPAARVVNVASMMAGGLDLSDVEWKRRSYNSADAYSQSKQCNRMLTWAFARRLRGTRVTANAMHPGAVDTALLHALIPGMQGRSTTKGAETAVWLSTSAETAGVSGKFWCDLRETPCRFHDKAAEEALWEMCDRMSGL